MGITGSPATTTTVPAGILLRRLLGALTSRNFAILWLGNLISNTATWMQQVAEPWLVLRLSNSPTLLGLDSFMADAPVWALILVGGLLADRGDRRRTALVFQSVQALCPSILVLLLLTGRIRVWMVIITTLVVGITDALSTPSINAMVPSAVTANKVPSAVALNSAQFNLSRVLGPVLAGLVMSAFGAVACFAVNAASYVPYLVALSLVRVPFGRRVAERDSPAAEVSMMAALRVVMKEPRLRRALLTVLTSSLFCAPTVTFIPVVIRDVFHFGSAQFASAVSTFGVGGVVGAIVVLPLATPRLRQIAASVAAIVAGALTVGIASDGSFRALLGMLFLLGTSMVASNTAANSIIQTTIEPRFRGRVSSIYTLAMRGGAPLGNLATGMIAARFSVRAALLCSGTLALVCHALLVVAIRRRSRQVESRRNREGPVTTSLWVARAGCAPRCNSCVGSLFLDESPGVYSDPQRANGANLYGHSAVASALREISASVTGGLQRDANGDDDMKLNILVGYDFSTMADSAVDFASELARTTGGSVHVFHVLLIPPTVTEAAMPIPYPTPEDIEIMRAKLRETLSARHVAAEAVVGAGYDAGEAICRVARSMGANLIVLGTHGRGGVRRAVLGSVADYVVRHADRPVTTIREDALPVTSNAEVARAAVAAGK